MIYIKLIIGIILIIKGLYSAFASNKDKKIEVKKRNVEQNDFFNDLQKRGKFYAKCIHEPETKVIVVYKYDGEEKELIFESLYPSVIFEKYAFEKND